MAVWVGLNLIGILRRWDPYPFILLAGNRQTQKDRLTLEHADREADHTSTRTLTILEEIRSNTELTVQVLGHVKTAHVANTNATA